jgi:hypothetical protein
VREAVDIASIVFGLVPAVTHPKSETRSPKEKRKSEIRNRGSVVLPPASVFGFCSSFGFLVSDFGLY